MGEVKIVSLALFISLVATMGSLFFSEIMHFVPCSLCWYQRIFMYPLVFIFLGYLLYPDRSLFKYSFPLVFLGLLVSIYHNLLMLGIISEDLSPCIQGVPCTSEYIKWFGFINIPLLSLVAFSAIFVLLLMTRRKIRNENI